MKDQFWAQSYLFTILMKSVTFQIYGILFFADDTNIYFSVEDLKILMSWQGKQPELRGVLCLPIHVIFLEEETTQVGQAVFMLLILFEERSR